MCIRDSTRAGTSSGDSGGTSSITVSARYTVDGVSGNWGSVNVSITVPRYVPPVPAPTWNRNPGSLACNTVPPVTVGGTDWDEIDFAWPADPLLSNATRVVVTHRSFGGRVSISTSGTVVSLSYTRAGNVTLFITPYNGSGSDAPRGPTRSFPICINP